jgi:phage shock protein A
MSIFKRFTNVIRSNVNDVLDKAEDPKKILDQTILDMEGEHKKAKKMLLETLTMQKQAAKQLEQYKAQSTDWESKAMAALKNGSEDLARQALAKKTEVDGLIPEAQQGLQQQESYTAELKVSVQRLEEKIGEAKSKRDELVARMNAADMKKKQAEGSASKDFTSESTAFDTFDRMVEKIENKEAEIEARSELFGDDDANAAMADLETELKKSSADDELEALKARMAADGKAPPPKPATPAADDDKASAIEDELAALRKKLEE